MKRTILIVLLILSTNSFSQELASYFDFDSTNKNTLEKHFICTSDSTLNITIRLKKIKQKPLQIEYYLINQDSVLLGKTSEKYFKNQYLTLSNSIFFINNENAIEEIKAEFIKNPSYKISQKNKEEYILKYKTILFQIIFNFDLKIHIENSYNEKIGNFLIAESKGKSTITYFEKEGESVIHSSYKRVFKKNKGLIYFEEEMDGILNKYQLIE